MACFRPKTYRQWTWVARPTLMSGWHCCRTKNIDSTRKSNAGPLTRAGTRHSIFRVGTRFLFIYYIPAVSPLFDMTLKYFEEKKSVLTCPPRPFESAGKSTRRVTRTIINRARSPGLFVYIKFIDRRRYVLKTLFFPLITFPQKIKTTEPENTGFLLSLLSLFLIIHIFLYLRIHNAKAAQSDAPLARVRLRPVF